MNGLNLATLIKGYDQAHERYLAARIARDSENLDIALFETLNWIVSIDDLISESLGRTWYQRAAKHPEQGLVIRGYRFVRNRVHHQWAQAVRLDGLEPPYQDWCWRDVSDLPEADSRFHNQALAEAYERRMAGRALRHTFRDLHQLFNRAFAILRVERQRPSPAETTDFNIGGDDSPESQPS